jgi:hypothetical protein
MTSFNQGGPLTRRSIRFPAVLAGLAVAATMIVAPTAPAQALPTVVSSYTTATAFTGTNSVAMPNVAAVAALSQGSIVSRFRTTSPLGAKALVSGSNTSSASSNLTQSINGENAHYEARVTGTGDLARLDWPIPQDRAGRLNDGQWHTMVTTVGASGTRVYIDGYQVHSGSSTAFFDDIPGLNSLKVGMNTDSSGNEWGFVGDIAATYVYGGVLTDAEVLALYPAPDTTVKWTPDIAYATTTPLGNKFPSSGAFTTASEGTIVARFRTTAGGTQAIVSAANTAHASTNMTIALQNGDLYYEHRTSGTYAAQVTVPGKWNDGRWHYVAVRVNDRGTVLYADGAEIARHASVAFMDDLTGANGIWVGGNVASSGSSPATSAR